MAKRELTPIWIIRYKKFYSNVNDGEWGDTWEYVSEKTDWDNNEKKVIWKQFTKEKAIEWKKYYEHHPLEYKDVQLLQSMIIELGE